MDAQPTPEKLQQWTDTAQELALEDWDAEKIAAHLRKRACEPALATAISKAVIKAARAHNRKRGLVSIVTGALILLGFGAFVLFAGGSGVHFFAPQLIWLPIAAAGMIVYGFFQLLFG